MNSLAIFVIGLGVFGLLLAGLYLTAREFIRVSKRPDLAKGANIAAFRRIDRDEAA